MKFSGNPDVVFIERETLSVEDSRVIKDSRISNNNYQSKDQILINTQTNL